MSALALTGTVIPSNLISMGTSIEQIVRSHCWRDGELHKIGLVKELDTKRIKNEGCLKRHEIDSCLEVGMAILASKDLNSSQKRDAIMVLADKMSRIN